MRFFVPDIMHCYLVLFVGTKFLWYVNKHSEKSMHSSQPIKHPSLTWMIKFLTICFLCCTCMFVVFCIGSSTFLWVCVRLLDLDFAICDVVWCWTIHPSWQADKMGMWKFCARKHFAVPVQSVNTKWLFFFHLTSVAIRVEYLLKNLEELLLVL